jgi:hypothetical protein
MAVLTIEVWSGNQGQARVTAGTKIPQAEGICRKGVTARGRAYPGLCSLSVPLATRQGVRGRFPSRRTLGLFLIAMLVACLVLIAGFLIVRRSCAARQRRDQGSERPRSGQSS